MKSPIAILLVLLTCALGSAGAAEKWRVLSSDGKTLPSDCVGQPVTPACIIDTVVACEVLTPRPFSSSFVAEDADVEILPPKAPPHCFTLAWVFHSFNHDGVLNFDIRYRGPRKITSIYRYRLESRKVNEQDMLHSRGHDWRLGDLAVDIWFERCDPDHCVRYSYPITAFFRLERSRWVMLFEIHDAAQGGSLGRPDYWDHWNRK